MVERRDKESVQVWCTSSSDPWILGTHEEAPPCDPKSNTLTQKEQSKVWLASSPPTLLVTTAIGVVTRLMCMWVGACVCRHLWIGVVAGMGKTNFTMVVPTIQSSRAGGWGVGWEARERLWSSFVRLLNREFVSVSS